MIWVQNYMEKVCKKHLHIEHLKDSNPEIKKKNLLSDLQQKRPFQDQILVIPFLGA